MIQLTPDNIELFKLKLNLLLTYLIFGATAKASAAAVPAALPLCCRLFLCYARMVTKRYCDGQHITVPIMDNDV